MTYDVAGTVLLYGVVLICAVSDLLYGKIYNVVTYPAALLGLVLALVAGGPSELLLHLAGFAIGFVPFFLVFLVRGIAGGDVKVMGAVGAIMGYPLAVSGLFHIILVGGVFAVSLMLWKGVLWRSVRNAAWVVLSWMLPMETRKLEASNSEKFGFGMPVAVGAIWATLESWQLLQLDL